MIGQGAQGMRWAAPIMREPRFVLCVHAYGHSFGPAVAACMLLAICLVAMGAASTAEPSSALRDAGAPTVLTQRIGAPLPLSSSDDVLKSVRCRRHVGLCVVGRPLAPGRVAQPAAISTQAAQAPSRTQAVE